MTNFVGVGAQLIPPGTHPAWFPSPNVTDEGQAIAFCPKESARQGQAPPVILHDRYRTLSPRTHLNDGLIVH